MEKKKMMIVGTAAAVAVLAVGGVTYTAMQKKQYEQSVTKVEKFLSGSKESHEKAKKAIKDSYLNEKKEFLKPNIDDKSMKETKEKVEAYTKNALDSKKQVDSLMEKDKKRLSMQVEQQAAQAKELQQEQKALDNKYQEQKTVNNLFEKPYLNGNKQTDQAIKPTTKKADVATTKKTYYTPKVTEEQSFEKAINNGIDSAEKQVAQVEKATEAVDNLVKNGKATDKVTKETAEQAKKEVEAIKSETIKKSFDDELKIIDEKVKTEAKVKEEKAKSEAEAKAKEVGGQVEKQADGTFVVKANDGQVYQAKGDGKVEVVKPTQNTSTNTPTTQPNTNAGTNTQPSNNGGSTQAQPSQPTQPSNNGGGDTQTQPTQPSNNGGSNTQTQPTQPSKPATPTIVSGYIGNTGMLFNTAVEANQYGESKMLDSLINGDGSITRYVTIGVFYSDGTKKFSVDLL
ncbi:hypothetical protein [Enterococcus cecorum]|uniref:hypothetical protein n=2 Tax=Enterococcus cecorum TaxID=44008 RepID=UPI003266150A